MGRLDARDAALFAVIALGLVAFGGIMVGPGLTVEQRASGAAFIFAALAIVAYRARSRRPPDDGAL